MGKRELDAPVVAAARKYREQLREEIVHGPPPMM